MILLVFMGLVHVTERVRVWCSDLRQLFLTEAKPPHVLSIDVLILTNASSPVHTVAPADYCGLGKSSLINNR